jgi:hypothetical protein
MPKQQPRSQLQNDRSIQTTVIGNHHIRVTHPQKKCQTIRQFVVIWQFKTRTSNRKLQIIKTIIQKLKHVNQTFFPKKRN